MICTQENTPGTVTDSLFTEFLVLENMVCESLEACPGIFNNFADITCVNGTIVLNNSLKLLGG